MYPSSYFNEIDAGNKSSSLASHKLYMSGIKPYYLPRDQPKKDRINISLKWIIYQEEESLKD